MMGNSEDYNDGYTHEALHAAHIACDMWDSHVVETRCVEEFPDVKAAASRAADAMYEVYQLIGSKFEDDEGTEHDTSDGKSGAEGVALASEPKA